MLEMWTGVLPSYVCLLEVSNLMILMRRNRLTLEFVDEVVDQTIVKVFTTQMGITGGRLDFENALLDGQEGDIESPTTKVEDQDVALTFCLLVETVGDGSSSGLVDDTEDVEASNETGILGSLTLGVVEVGWDSDNSIVDGATKIGFSSFSHLGQDHGGDLFRCEVLVLTLELDRDNGLALLLDNLEREVLHVGLDLGIVEFPSDQTLSVEDCVCRVHGNLVLCSISNQSLCVGEGHEGGSGTIALIVGDDFDTIISEDAHT